MPILVTCGDSACRKSLRVKDELAGKTIKCPACQKPIRVSLPPSAEPSAPNPAVLAKRAESIAPAATTRTNSRSVDRQSKSIASVLTLPRLVLRPKRGLKGIFSTDLDILDAETREVVGLAGDRTKKLLGLFKVNPNTERWEILDDDGEVLFGIQITKERGFVSGNVEGIECDLHDRKERPLGGYRYKLKGVVMKGWQLGLVDAEGEGIARVSIASGNVMAGEAPRITLSSLDGQELGYIAHKGITDVMAMMKQKKAEGKKFGMVNQVGEPGLEVTVAEDSVGDLDIHRALIALAVIVEVTKIGKEQVSLNRH